MSKRILIVVVAVVAAILATNLVGVTDSEGFWRGGFWRHRGKTPINWKVSGTIAFVRLAYSTPEGDPLTPPGILVDSVVKGVPENAHFKVIGEPNPTPIFAPTEECGNHFKVEYERNDMVVTFADQSMFFAILVEGYACIFNSFAFAEPLPSAVFEMEVTGGTGRYMNATGNFVGKFDGIPVGPPVYPPGAFLAETGTIKGWIER
jgi:hypothetical protein